MPGFIKIVPNFSSSGDVDKPAEGKFRSLRELNRIGFVKTWAEGKDFSRFSFSPNSDGSAILVAEMKDGGFWAVGNMGKGYESLGLPKWEFKKP